MEIQVSSEDVATYYESKAAEVRKKIGGEPNQWLLQWPGEQVIVRLVGRTGKKEKCSSNFAGIPHHVELHLTQQ